MDEVLSLRAFVPARDYRLSQRFYRQLGFETELDTGEVTLFRSGSQGFLLQNFYVKELAGNFVLQLTVRDLDAWWAALDGEALVREFGVQAPRAPSVQPWGLRVAYLFDPSGVLWHVTEPRSD